MSEESKRRIRRIGAGVGVGAGVCGALLALALIGLTGAPGGTAQPGWVKDIVTGLGQRGYDWIVIDVSDRVATVSGAAPDVDSHRYGFEAAETELQRGPHAGEVSLVIDATQLEGGPEGVGAALAALGPDPEAGDCQNAFRHTLDGRTINFAPASAALTDDNKRLLDALAGVTLRCKAFRVEIGGHTDASGDPQANNALSEARADAVRAYLLARGAPEAGLDAHGYGSRVPLDTARTPAADAKNRRIEFTVATN